MSKINPYSHLNEDDAAASLVRLGDDATADQVSGQLPQNIVIEPISTGEGSQYTITVNVQPSASKAELRDKLQAAYDEGAAGSFSILTEGNARKIVFRRDFSDDYEILLSRVNKGEPIHSAARSQLADELEKFQSGPDCLTAIIVTLRDHTNGVVVGLAEHRKLRQEPSDVQSAELKQRFKAHFATNGIDGGLSAGLEIAKGNYPLEWDEACREFEMEGRLPEIGAEYMSTGPEFEGTVKVTSVSGDRIFYEGDADGSASLAEFHKAYSAVERVKVQESQDSRKARAKAWATEVMQLVEECKADPLLMHLCRPDLMKILAKLEQAASADSEARRIAGLVLEGGDENVLDSVVHDECSALATGINNDGTEAQVKYLLANGWTEAMILKETGVDRTPSAPSPGM